MTAETRYARSGEVGIAYQVLGEGAMDLVIAFPFVSHLDLMWESPPLAHFLRRLGSFARVIVFDRRGVGLSDPAAGAPTLEERMDDVRAVMDAAGSERAALLGMSEGATIEIFSPSMAGDARAREFQARFERQAASPMRVQQLFKMFLDTDVRGALPLIQAPTLVLHRRHDCAVNYRAARWLAEQIEGSRYAELEGEDHFPWVGDSDAALAAIEEFLTGVRPRPATERVLATVLFTDIVDSTRLATEMGDRRWRALLEEHQGLVRDRLRRFEGREIKTTGDGFLATFGGPTRAAECARAIADDMPSLGIEVRAGLHTGEVELMGDDVGGIAVHVAARVAALAAAGEVTASRTVRDLAAGSGVDFRFAGRHTLKGVAEEWDVYSVAAIPPSAGSAR